MNIPGRTFGFSRVPGPGERRPRRAAYVLPTLFTSGNIFLGFLAILKAFEGALDIRAIPLFPPDTVRQVFVDVTYEDPANNYRREERLEIPGNATAPVPLRIGLLDPARRTFRHRITIVTIDGRLIQGPPIDGEETLLGVGQLT